MADSEIPHTWKPVFQDENNDLFVSSATRWELEIKKGLGKVEYSDNLLEVLQDSQND